MSESRKVVVYAGTHKIKMLVNQHDTIPDFINTLERETGISSEELCQMHEERKYGDSEGLHLLYSKSTVILQGILDLYLHLPNGKTHMIFVLDSQKISKLYPVIERKTGIKMDGKILEIGGERVEKDSTFFDQNIRMDSAVLIKK
ncbi:hypothetical protein M3Y97_01098500 [Aphelenchoides bicaudatus]|nr:hypothetical protein M3Y97_01098500 [Aphelenchoides bicaudatus]